MLTFPCARNKPCAVPQERERERERERARARARERERVTPPLGKRAPAYNAEYYTHTLSLAMWLAWRTQGGSDLHRYVPITYPLPGDGAPRGTCLRPGAKVSGERASERERARQTERENVPKIRMAYARLQGRSDFLSANTRPRAHPRVLTSCPRPLSPLEDTGSRMIPCTILAQVCRASLVAPPRPLRLTPNGD